MLSRALRAWTTLLSLRDLDAFLRLVFFEPIAPVCFRFLVDVFDMVVFSRGWLLWDNEVIQLKAVEG